MNLFIGRCSRTLPKLNYFRALNVRAVHSLLQRGNSLQPARIEHIPSARCCLSGSQPFCTYRPFSISTTNNIKGLSDSVNTESEYFQSITTYSGSISTTTSGHDAVNLEPSAADVVSSDTLTQVSDFASLGLGGYSPTGLVQTALELIHNTTHLPWWASIGVLTLAVRLTLFPLAVKLYVHTVRMANINPQITALQKKMNERKAAGDHTGQIEAGVELRNLFVQQKVNPLAIFLPFLQLPIFISIIFALRGMAELPVESFRTGGMYWFTDLTVADPTYLLPLIACVSFIVNIELGGESGAVSQNEMQNKIMWMLRLSAIAILPISVKFPAAMFMYWITNSLISSVQILAFKLPSVKKALGIPRKNIIVTKPDNIKT